MIYFKFLISILFILLSYEYNILYIQCLSQSEIYSFMNGDLIPSPPAYITNCTEVLDLAMLSHVHIVTSRDSMAGVSNAFSRTLRYRSPSNQSREIPFGQVFLNTDNGYSLSSFSHFEIRNTELRKGREPSSHALNHHLLTPAIATYISTRDASLPVLEHVRLTVRLYIDCIGSLETLDPDSLYVLFCSPVYTGCRLVHGTHLGLFVYRDIERESSNLPIVGSRMRAPVSTKHTSNSRKSVIRAVSVDPTVVAPSAQFTFRPVIPGEYSMALVQLKGPEVSHNTQLDTVNQETNKMVTSTFIYNTGILLCTIMTLIITLILYKLGQRDSETTKQKLNKISEKQDRIDKSIHTIKENIKQRYNINDQTSVGE